MIEIDVCVYGYIYPNVEATNIREGLQMACTAYFEETGLKAKPEDEAVVWKESYMYPYVWR